MLQVTAFNAMYELYDPCTVMFFFRNKHIMIDLGTGNNNKVNWAMTDKQEFIDIVETVYRGARKGRGLVVSPKGVCASSCSAGLLVSCCEAGSIFLAALLPMAACFGRTWGITIACWDLTHTLSVLACTSSAMSSNIHMLYTDLHDDGHAL